jgi:hypothetical protein
MAYHWMIIVLNVIIGLVIAGVGVPIVAEHGPWFMVGFLAVLLVVVFRTSLPHIREIKAVRRKVLGLPERPLTRWQRFKAKHNDAMLFPFLAVMVAALLLVLKIKLNMNTVLAALACSYVFGWGVILTCPDKGKHGE